jgi:hypothetical protein
MFCFVLVQNDMCVGSNGQQEQMEMKMSPGSNNCVVSLNGHVDFGQGGGTGAPVAIPVSVHGPIMVHGHGLVPNNPVDLSSPARMDDRRPQHHQQGYKQHHHGLQPIGTLLNLGNYPFLY